MGTLQPESETKTDMDDSGCVVDSTTDSKKDADDGYRGSVELLDLSDDVLLCILKYCSPRDLKALGFTCPRLGVLICDRTLWQVVDARSEPCGRARLRWYINHVLYEGTTELLLTGFAREARGCLGLVERTREDVEAENAEAEMEDEEGEPSGDEQPSSSVNIAEAPGEAVAVEAGVAREPRPLVRQHARLHINAQPASVPATSSTGPPRLVSPSMSTSPSWPEEWEEAGQSESTEAPVCRGPRFTLTQCMLRQLQARCIKLTHLSIQYCNIKCNSTGICNFPPTLKRLSLRGTKCYNLPLDKPFLFKIPECLPQLEYLDVSECEWMEPASVMPLGKMPSLQHLVMQDCYRMSEFVAYASLTTRYGFKKLRVLDLRGSPVSDSEVSCLGWLPRLEELYLSPAPAVPPWPREHSHYKDDAMRPRIDLADWECNEPEYFKSMEHPPIDTDLECGPMGLLRCYRGRCTAAAADERAIRIATAAANARQAEQEDRNTPKRRPEENGSGDSAKNGPSPKRKKSKSRPGKTSPPKKASPPKQPPTSSPKGRKRKSNSHDSDADKPKKTSVNEGASTSRGNKSTPPPPGIRRSPRISKRLDCASSSKGQKSDSDSSDDETIQKKSAKVEKYIRFRQNQEPVIIECPVVPPEQDREPEPREHLEAEPRHHILYVNVGQQLHAVYRLLPSRPTYHTVRNRAWRPSLRNIFYSPPTPHLDATSLVTDSAVQRFGRADGAHINYIHIGPNGPYPAGADPGARPDRSSLRILSITGFFHITDRSLVHLATAAPQLRLIDFRETRVTAQGVENFKSLRPDCEVRFSEYIEKDELQSD